MGNRYQLFVIRHLRTEDNLANRFCSGDRDVHILSGQKISTELIKRIRSLGGNYLLAHTGLIRTKETADKLQKMLNYSGKIFIFSEFKERFGGKLAGMDFNKIQEIFPHLINPCDLWKIESSLFNLENLGSFINRIERGLRRTFKIKRDIVLIAHAGSIKGIRAVLETDKESLRKKILCQETPKNLSYTTFYLRKET